MSTPHPLPPKKEVALALLERSSVHVHLDPRGEGVVVPTWFKKQPQLVLQIGLNMPVPIPDLRLDDEGMTCTLSFNRAPFYCVVPWGSVFAMVGDDGRGMVWPEDVPPEIAAQAQQARPQPAEATKPQAVPPPRPAPKRAPAEATAADDKPKTKKPRAKKQPRIGASEAEEQRPVLVAVPPPAEKRPRPDAAKRPRPNAPGAKPKRELPPYLRVVK